VFISKYDIHLIEKAEGEVVKIEILHKIGKTIEIALVRQRNLTSLEILV
jgi:hypothetical protein